MKARQGREAVDFQSSHPSTTTSIDIASYFTGAAVRKSPCLHPTHTSQGEGGGGGGSLPLPSLPLPLHTHTGLPTPPPLPAHASIAWCYTQMEEPGSVLFLYFEKEGRRTQKQSEKRQARNRSLIQHLSCVCVSSASFITFPISHVPLPYCRTHTHYHTHPHPFTVRLGIFCPRQNHAIITGRYSLLSLCIASINNLGI